MTDSHDELPRTMDSHHAADPLTGQAEPVSPGVTWVPFEELTVGEALRYLALRPVEVGRRWWAVLTADAGPDSVRLGRREARQQDAFIDADDLDDEPEDAPGSAPSGTRRAPGDSSPDGPGPRVRLLVAWAVALLLAMRGGIVLRRAALDPAMHSAGDTGSAWVWLGAAILLALAVEVGLARAWWSAFGQRIATWAGGRWRAESLPEMGTAETGDDHGQDADQWRDALPGDASPAESPYVVRSRVAALPESAADPAWRWMRDHMLQLALIPVALILSALAYNLNVRTDAFGRVIDVVLTGGGVVAWALSVMVWAVVLGGWRGLSGWRQAWPRGQRVTWVLPALAAITGLAAVIRLHSLSAVPPEMTSDHIEKLLDALRVHEGYYAVFFPNNGGREAFQMYLVALVARLPGVGFTFDALKLATVIEGVLTIPALWWMARQIVGTQTPRDRQIGHWIGLMLAGLAAVSAWHLMLSRLGLRIVLTPLTTALVIGLLARAMRHRQLGDFLALGAVLGAGVYFYQANRMLPAVAVAGAALAVLGTLRSWRDLRRALAEAAILGAVVGVPLAVYLGAAHVLDGAGGDPSFGARMADVLPLVSLAWLAVVALAARGRGSVVMQVGGGMLAAAVIALALVVPMVHYSQVQPDQFWNRTRGRMFGDEAFVRVDPVSGQRVTYDPSLGEQLERYWEVRAVLADNLADALRMFHWQGDAGWISNPGGYPALDGVTGGLLILGAALWGVWLVRRRDPVLALVPVAGLIMLLPSAMTVAYTIENPSFTRASGALPVVLLVAALPVARLAAWLAERGRRAWRVPVGGGVAALLLAGTLWGAAATNWDVFFTDYRLQYAYSWKPYHAIAAPVRAFVGGEGRFGNAFMIAYPHWLDHRILGAVAGDIRWPNGLVTRDQLGPQILRNVGTPYAYDPDRPLFVMFHTQDTATADWLRAQFPGGQMELYTYSYETQVGVLTGDFWVYRAWAGPIE